MQEQEILTRVKTVVFETFGPPVESLSGATTEVEAAVRRFTRGMTGIAHEQHPIHPLVAERLRLQWCDAQMLFRSFKTR